MFVERRASESHKKPVGAIVLVSDDKVAQSEGNPVIRKPSDTIEAFKFTKDRESRKNSPLLLGITRKQSRLR